MGVGVSNWTLARAVSRTGQLGVVSGAALATAPARRLQLGTAFAFCEESGLTPEVKAAALRRSRAGTARVFTDPRASPTGFPFKTLGAEGTLSEESVYRERKRGCDLGYLRTPYRREDGSVGYRFPGEPEDDYLRKGGTLEATQGRKCVCNGLFAAIGLGQTGDGKAEPPLITAGDDVSRIAEFLPEGKESYVAADVVEALLGR